MDIVVNSRHCELTDRFRDHVEEKLARLEKHDHRVIRVEVEVEKERNPARPTVPSRVQLDGVLEGPGGPRRGAPPRTRWPPSTMALDQMAAQMRRAADRKRCTAVAHPGRWPGHRRPVPVTPGARPTTSATRQRGRSPSDGDGPLVREKTHPAAR